MKRLHTLNPMEVSMVRKGANKKKFLIFKSGETEMNKEILELIKKADPEKLKKIDAIIKGFDKLDEESGTALQAATRILAAFHGKIPVDAVVKAMNEAGYGMEMHHPEGEEDAEYGLMTTMPAKPEKMSKAMYKDACSMAQKSFKDHVEKLGYQMYPTEHSSAGVDKAAKPKDEDDVEKQEDEVEKAIMKADGTPDWEQVDEKSRPLLEQLWKTNSDLVKKAEDSVKRAEETEKVLKAEREQRITKEFAEKAAGFKAIGADRSKLAGVMKSLSEKDPEAYKELEGILKAADEQIAKGDLFTELGSRLSGGGGDADAIEAAAEAYVAKSGEGKELPKAQKVMKFLETSEGKEMYALHQSKRPGGA